MKYFNGSVAAVLLAAIILTTFSCGEGVSDDTTIAETTQETTEKVGSDRLDELGERDFSGKVFSVLDANGSPNLHQNIPAEEENGDAINDALYRRDRYISDRYKIEISYEQNNSDVSVFQNSVLAGDRNYDMVISILGNEGGSGIGRLQSAGVLADLNSFDYLSLDREWWSPLIHDSCNINGIMYYTAGDIAPSIYCAPGCIYMNKKLADEYRISIDDIYTSVTDGKWTYDLLGSLTKDLSRDLNGDDKMRADDDFFGMLNEPNRLSAAVFLSGAGIDLSTIDRSGNLTTELGSEKTIDAIEKLRSVLTNAEYENLHSAFIGDRAIFMMHYVSSAYTRYRDMESDFAILPIPKFDEEQETYRSLVNTWCNSFIGVALDVKDDYVPFIMEALAYYSHINVRPAAYDNAFKQKGARDDRDAEMLDIIFDTLYLDFNSFSNFGGSVDALSRALFKDESFSSTWASIKDATSAAMETFAKAWLKS